MFIALQGWWRFPYSSSGHRWLPVRMSFYDDPNLTSHFIHYDQTEVRTAGQEATPIFYMEVNAELNWTKVEDWTTSWVLGLIPAALGWDAVIKLYEHPHSHPHPTELQLKYLKFPFKHPVKFFTYKWTSVWTGSEQLKKTTTELQVWNRAGTFIWNHLSLHFVSQNSLVCSVWTSSPRFDHFH